MIIVDNNPVITKRVSVLYDERITTGPAVTGKNGSKRAPLIKREVLLTKAQTFFSKDSIVLDLATEGTAGPCASPDKPQGTLIDAQQKKVVYVVKKPAFTVPRAASSSTISVTDSHNAGPTSQSSTTIVPPDATHLGSALNMPVRGEKLSLLNYL